MKFSATMWWGIAIGGLVGWLSEGVFAGVVCAFIGWLAGLVIDSARKAPTPGKPVPAPVKPAKVDRLAELEARVAALEARLARGDVVVAPREAVVEAPAEMPPPLPAQALAAAEMSVVEIPPPIPATQPLSVKPAAVTLPKVDTPNPFLAWITGGNAIARIGIVVLFVGIAFLLRHAVEEGLLSPIARVSGIAAGGFVLLGLGWRLRLSRPGYGLSLLGAGIGVLYLAVYGAFRLYEIIPAGVAFPLLVLIAVFATWMAVRLDSPVLAGFGVAGGFLAPVLASTGRGDHVMLFSYYAVLNLGILVTAWFRSWRSLNLLGFVFTFIVAMLWGFEYYRPEHFATTEPFLVFFFLLYVGVAVLFAKGTTSPAGRFVDATLVFGVPLVGFGLQSGLVKDFDKGLAWSALALAVFYVVLASVLWLRGREAWRLLVQSFLALGVVFATVTIPLAFEAQWTSAAWALEGAAIVWIGVRQGQRLTQAFGLILQVLAGGAFALSYNDIPAHYPVANGVFLGAFLLAAGGLISHLVLRALSPKLASAFFLWALAWWLGAVLEDIERFVPDTYEANAALAAIALTVLGFAIAYRGTWREAAWPSLGLLPVMIVFLMASATLAGEHPFARLGWLAWAVAIGSHLASRRLIEGSVPAKRGGWTTFMHAGLLLFLTVLLTWEVNWQVVEAGLRRSGWASVSLAVVPALLLLFVSTRSVSRNWPVLVHPTSYLRGGAVPIVLALWLWVFAANLLHSGRLGNWPYWPLFNGLDFAHVLAGLAVAAWIRALARRGIALPFGPRVLQVGLGAAAFAWANGILLRVMHHWFAVPYNVDAWLASFRVQASLSIFWSLLALSIMVYATRSARRALWMAGAALLGLVVVKLMLVDFSHLDGLERIASFIGVGVPMLVVGYFSPVPPKRVSTP